MKEFKEYLDKAILEKSDLIKQYKVNNFNYTDYQIQVAKLQELLDIRKVINL